MLGMKAMADGNDSGTYRQNSVSRTEGAVSFATVALIGLIGTQSTPK